MKTWKILVLIYIVSRSLHSKPNGRGERVLVVLYSELARRYNGTDASLQGRPGNPHNKL